MDSHKIIWVVNFDSTICRFFNFSKKHKLLKLIKELNHPENKLRDIELTSDKSGHYKSSSSAHGSFVQPTDPKEIKIESFAREIANELEHTRKHQSYDKLIIIAAPHMYGLFLKHINQHVKKLITQNIEKDFIHKSNSELLDFLINLK